MSQRSSRQRGTRQQQGRLSGSTLAATLHLLVLSLLLLLAPHAPLVGAGSMAPEWGRAAAGGRPSVRPSARPPLPNPPGLALGIDKQRERGAQTAAAAAAAAAPDACVQGFEAPTIATVHAANRELTLALLPPPNLHHSCLPVTAYRVTDSRERYSARVQVDGQSTSTTEEVMVRLSGLQNGVQLTLVAYAENGDVRSLPSSTVEATPATVPGAPLITATREGAQSIVVTFSPPSDDGGSPITAYSVIDLRGSQLDVTTTTSPLLITGLQDGHVYQLVLIASNSIGDGPQSAPTPLLIPQPLPLKPHMVAVQSGLSKTLRVYFFDPSPGPIGSADSFRVMARSDAIIGGSPVVRVTAVAARSPAELTGLVDGVVYNISCAAVNEVGEGPPSRSISVAVGAGAVSFSHFPASTYLHRCVNGYADAPATSSFYFLVPPIPWPVLARVNVSTLVDCNYPPPPVPPTPDGSTALPFPHVNFSSSSTGAGGGGGGGGGATGMPVSPPVDSVPPAGAVRLEILLEFDGRIDVTRAGTEFWTGMVARWADLLGVAHQRIVIVSMDPNAPVDTKKRAPSTLLAARHGRDAASLAASRSRMRVLAARAAVVLVVDILPPLSDSDLMTSTRMAANLTDALEDPNSPVGQQLTSNGASVAKVSLFANVGPPLPPEDDNSSFDTTSQSFRIGLGIGGAMVVVLCGVLAVVLMRYWKHRHEAAKQEPPAGDNQTAGAATDDVAAAAVATAVTANGTVPIDRDDYAQRGAFQRGVKPARPDPVFAPAPAADMECPLDRAIVHLHEHSEPVTVERRDSYLRDAMRMDPEYVVDPEYSLYRREVLNARHAQAAAAVRASPPRHQQRRRTTEFNDQNAHYVFQRHMPDESQPTLGTELHRLPNLPAVEPAAVAAAVPVARNNDASLAAPQHNFYEVDADAFDPTLFFPALLETAEASMPLPAPAPPVVADRVPTDDSSPSSPHSPAPLIRDAPEPLQLPLQQPQQHISPVSPLPPAAIPAPEPAPSTEGASLFARSAPLLPPFSFAAASITPAV